VEKGEIGEEVVGRRDEDEDGIGEEGGEKRRKEDKGKEG
jgi:hypothetical protein